MSLILKCTCKHWTLQLVETQAKSQLYELSQAGSVDEIEVFYY